ncbi:MAG: ABC transporter permease [Gemmatimonadota bacterium]|nr:MAG: ABC transporter permease [Gemmatimonadota bacterium]
MADIKHAIRSLIATPGLTAVVVITFAIAVGANTAIFGVLNGVILQPLDYPSSDRLVMLWENSRGQGLDQQQTSGATYLDWRARSRTLQDIAIYRYGGFTLTDVQEPLRVSSVQVSPSLFRVLQSDAQLGRTFTQEEEAPGHERLVVLSNAAWSTHFGSDPNVIGNSISLDGEPYTIVGVMPTDFAFPPDDPDVQMWSPLTLDLNALLSRPHRMYDAIARLGDGVTQEQVTAEMNTIAEQIAQENPESMQGWGVTVIPAIDELVGNVSQTLWFLSGAVLLVLLIGCVNITNVLLARSATALKDYAIRAAHGAGAASLFKRSLTESLVLALSGGLAGMLIAYWGVDLLRGVIPPDIPRADQISIDSAVLVFALAISLLAGIAFGIVPGLKVMRPDVAEVLQEGSRGSSVGRRSRRFTNMLVAGEVALALMLMVGAGLMVRSYLKLTGVDPGFRKENVVAVVVSLPQSRYPQFEQQRQFFTALIDRLERIPGFEEASAVTKLPLSRLGTGFEAPFSVEGLDAVSPTERPRADYRGTFPGYFRTMGIPLVQGRLFDNLDGLDGRIVAIVNQTTAERYFPGDTPLGKVITMPMVPPMEIVGVVGDVRHDGLDAASKPELFVPFVQLPLSEMHIVVHTEADEGVVAATLRDEIRQLDPQLPLTEVSSIEDLLSSSVSTPRFNMALLLGLAFCAVVLAMVGIYGTISYSVTQRTRDIGVRMALGADGGDTVWLIVSQVLWVLAIGIVLGVLGSLALSRVMTGLLFGVANTDPVTYLIVGCCIVIVGIAASVVPAMRATRIDPVEALRQE